MAEIALARVDARMIHGAVVSTWVPNVNANILIAIDDETFEDEFICNIMKNCAINTRCEIYSVKKFVEVWNSGKLKNRKVLLVFKSIDMAYKTFKLGVQFSALQLGYIIPDKDKTIQVDERNCVRVSPEDIQQLKELNQEFGVNVYMQYSPQFTPVTYTEYGK